MVNISMDFFKNGTGWCIRHRDPKAPKPVTSVKHQAPIFRKRQAASAKLQAASDKFFNLTTLIKFQAARAEVHG